MKKILLPTDFSPNSLNAIHYAVDLFKGRECDFYLLNVLKASTFISDDLMTMTPVESIYQSLIDASKKNINHIISKIKAENNDNKHGFHAIVDYDNFIDAINQLCQSEDIDLIIMGTKGASGLDKVLFGSNTIRVIQRCSTPVLAIPKNYKFNGLERIVFTSNYSTLYNLNELLQLLEISRLFNSKIQIIHLTGGQDLSHEQENNKAFLDAYFSNLDHEFIDLNSDKIFETVNTYISNNNIKLLAMMSRKHSFFERLFVTHNVETFTFKIQVPLLVMENSGKLYK